MPFDEDLGQDARTGNNYLPDTVDDADTIKILIATDNHVGYAEKCKVRGYDSVASFEEILYLAQKNDVDMILLGGDLFHDNKPSRAMVHAVINLLRKYTMGDKPCQLEFLSDPSLNFKHNKFPIVNYEDPNMNVSYPVFSIHGNHDDPSGNNLCALDVLSSAGLVNYFGKCDSLEKVEVSPILIKKGQTKLALYGLGCIRDERLHRLFEQQKVSILKHKDDWESWFNIFTIHQNRAKHSEKDYIPESFLGDFLDLVLWGHEHECRIDPEFNGHFWVTQPGSSVATSLSEGEAKRKHCGLLKINKKNFSLTKLPLETIRPFYFEDIVLSSTDIKPEAFHEKKVLKYCQSRVEHLIELAIQEQESRTNSRNRQSMLPLIRLRVDYTGGYEVFNSVQFGQQFVDRVANPKDIVLFNKKRQGRAKGEILYLDDVDAHVSELSHDTIEELVNEYLNAVKSKDVLKLEVLSERGMGKAVGEFVKKDDNDAILTMVDYQIKSVNEGLNKKQLERDTDITDSIRKLRDEIDAKSQDELDSEFNKVLEESSQARAYIPPTIDSNSDSELLDNPPSVIAKKKPAAGSSKTGRGSRGGGRGSRGGRRGRGSRSNQRQETARATALTDVTNDDDSDDVCVISATQSGKSSKPPAKKFKGIIIGSDDEDDYLPGRRSYK